MNTQREIIEGSEIQIPIPARNFGDDSGRLIPTIPSSIIFETSFCNAFPSYVYQNDGSLSEISVIRRTYRPPMSWSIAMALMETMNLPLGNFLTFFVLTLAKVTWR